MGTQAADLLSRYTASLNEILAEIDSLPEAGLRQTGPNDQRTVAGLAGHMADVTAGVAGWAQSIVDGEPLPELTMDDIHHSNAVQATHNDGLSKGEVRQRLQESGAKMTAVLQGLSDEDLSRSAPLSLFGGDVTAPVLVEQAVIAHTGEHLASMRAAASNAAPSASGD